MGLKNKTNQRIEMSAMCIAYIMEDLQKETGKSPNELINTFKELHTDKYLNNEALLITSITGDTSEFNWMKDVLMGRIQIDG